MENQEQLLQQLHTYLVHFPSEKERISSYTQFVQNHNGEHLYDRKNFVGHITASAFIVNTKKDKLLLLHHKFLNRWLQPGGHVDMPDGSLINAALREAVEETGLPVDCLHPAFDGVFDFDSHAIPENARKQEKAHVHHDARFLFICTEELALNRSKEESNDCRWVPFAEVLANGEAEFNMVVHKVKSLLDL